MTTDGAQLAASLPDDLAGCHALIEVLREQVESSSRKISTMEQQLQQLLRRLYGASAEKIDPAQRGLFEDLLRRLRDESPADSVPAPTRKPAGSNGHGRRRLAADLPRERIVHDLPEAEKACPGCGQRRALIGEETSEQLDYVPAKVKVLEHVRLKYACRFCEREASAAGAQIEVACKPLAPIEKGLAAPGLLAHVIVSKYADHLPLYRLEKIFARYDVELSRSTLCDWMRQSAEALEPLYAVMVADVLDSKVIHTDDTPVKVQAPGRGKTRTGRFWVYLGDEDHPQVVYDYTPSRNRDGPMTFLEGWGQDENRYLQADAFGGYDGIYAGDAGGDVTEVACWAHARRKFHEARKSDHRHSAEALAQIRLLYDTEGKAREIFQAQADASDAPPRRSLSEIRLSLRQSESVERLGRLRSWLEGLQATSGGSVLPKSPMGQAITYALNQWEALCVYTTDGDLAIDNNAAENALRPIAVGRKNWLFAGSDRGGRTAAVLLSLIATCRRHDVEPWGYLHDVLTRVAAHPASRLRELLPQHHQPQP